jgi:ABC-2 type transport system permease protein
MELAVLLRPKLFAARPGRTGAEGRRPLRVLVFGGMGVAFAAGLFLLSHWFLGQVLGVDIIGEIIAKKLLSIMFMTFFFILVFSNMVTALSTFYLADDLQLVLSMPVRFESFFWARYLEMAFHSSWTVVLFSLPVLAAFGVVFHAGPAYYVLAAAVMFLFVFVPAAIGASVTTVLVNVFPAHRLREVLLVLGIVAFVGLYLLVRLMEPERFLNPEGFGTMIEFVARFNAPEFVLLPSYWAAETLFPALKRIDLQPRFLLSLVTTAAGVSFAASWFVHTVYVRGVSKAHEGRKAGLSRSALLDQLVGLAAFPFSPLSRSLFVKDFKVFLRQPSQWTQLLLLLALVFVYIYNFKHFRNIAATGLLSQWGLYFINIGLSGFVVASVGIRFVFPAVSLEGRSFYIVKSAPVTMRRFLAAKFAVYLAPLLLLGVAMTAASNMVIGTSAEYFALSTVITALAAVAVTGLGIGAGAVFPKFSAENPAIIASSYGGVIYMIVSMSAVAALVILTIWPTAFLRSPGYFVRMGAAAYWVIGLHAVVLLAVTAACTVIPLRLGARSLERLEQ